MDNVVNKLTNMLDEFRYDFDASLENVKRLKAELAEEEEKIEEYKALIHEYQTALTKLTKES